MSSCDLAVVGARVLTGVANARAVVSEPSVIEITGGLITAITPGTDAPVATIVVDATGAVAMPGLINGHCHAAMTLLRGAAEDVPVDAWFNDYIWPMEVNLVAHDVYLGTLLAAAESIASGVTTFVDHYFYEDEAARAVADAGVRANLGSAFFTSQGAEGLDRSVAFAEQWNGAAGGRISTSIAPHATYTVSDEQLAAVADQARRLGVRVHVHAAETIEQTDSSLATRGITPIEVLARTGVLDAGAIIAHGNGIVASDLDTLAAHADRIGVVHCPKGYLKAALTQLTPIRALRSVGVPVGLGTDGAASNNTLDVMESMRVTALTQKQINADATWFTVGEALEMATTLSASAVGLGGGAGSLAVGNIADLILVDLSGPHCQPVHDIAATLVYSANAADVRTTIVDGKVLMLDRKLTTIDVPAVAAEATERARTISDRSHGRTIQTYAP